MISKKIRAVRSFLIECKDPEEAKALSALISRHVGTRVSIPPQGYLLSKIPCTKSTTK